MWTWEDLGFPPEPLDIISIYIYTYPLNSMGFEWVWYVSYSQLHSQLFCKGRSEKKKNILYARFFKMTLWRSYAISNWVIKGDTFLISWYIIAMWINVNIHEYPQMIYTRMLKSCLNHLFYSPAYGAADFDKSCLFLKTHRHCNIFCAMWLMFPYLHGYEINLVESA